jgi:hypothetical protein
MPSTAGELIVIGDDYFVEIECLQSDPWFAKTTDPVSGGGVRDALGS